nr:AI-2E family transporter [Flaviflexus huanghaiensis]
MKLFSPRQKTSPTAESPAAVGNEPVPSVAPELPGVTSGVPPLLAKFGLGSWYLIGIIIFVAFIVFATANVNFIFVTVFLAFVATSVLRPITDLLARWLPRALAMILSLVLVIGAFAGLIAFVVISVRSEWDDLASQFSEGIDSIFELVENAPLPWNVSSDEPQQWISQTIDDGIAWIQENTGEITSQVMSGASSIGLGIMILSLATLITVFFLMSGAQMWLWFLNELPDKHRDTTHRAAMAGWLAFSGYARGTVIIGLINGALAFLLLIVLGVPLAAPLAVLVVIGTFIPLIGAPAAMIIATIVALAANGIAVAFIVLIGIALIGQLEGNVLQPLIMGKQVSLHPTVIALGVAAGTLLAGLFGAIIAIPILSVLWAVYKVLRKQDPPRQTLPDVDKDELLET